ncbi:hypothetical protein T31B1_16450 [Salinisphaera sp. T31B1]
MANTPVVSTFAAFFPSDEDVSAQAADIPYASIDLTIAGSGGLLALSEQSGGLTFWQTSGNQAFVFRNGYLDATRGLPIDLESTEVAMQGADGVAPWQADQNEIHYRVVRTWSDEDGELHSGRADATLVCRNDSERVELPLATLGLQRCDETLRWADGPTTHSTLWRDPGDRRLWAVDTVAWPGGDRIVWRVARPWW